MKRSVIFLIFFGIFLISALVFVIAVNWSSSGVPFSASWNTSKNSSMGSSNSTTISLPLEAGGTYNFTIDWGMVL